MAIWLGIYKLGPELLLFAEEIPNADPDAHTVMIGLGLFFLLFSYFFLSLFSFSFASLEKLDDKQTLLSTSTLSPPPDR